MITAIHNIQNVSFEKDIMNLIIDGKTISVSLIDVSSKLLEADEIKRNMYVISPSGYGIHWPLLDEDLSINAILKRVKK